MDIRPLHTENDYRAALVEVSALVDRDPETGTPEGDKLEVLSILVEYYERGFSAALREAQALKESGDACALPCDEFATGQIEALKGVIRNPGQPVSVEDMNPATVSSCDNLTDAARPSAQIGQVDLVLRRLQQNMNDKTRRDPPPAVEADDWIVTWNLGDEISQPSVRTWVPKAEYFAFQALRSFYHGAGDHAYRVLRMQALADKVFDDRLAAMLWLLAATPQLDGIRPIDALATERGHDRVRALLQCLARGSE